MKVALTPSRLRRQPRGAYRLHFVQSGYLPGLVPSHFEHKFHYIVLKIDVVGLCERVFVKFSLKSTIFWSIKRGFV